MYAPHILMTLTCTLMYITESGFNPYVLGRS
jgi:hypothetical protein